MLYARWKASLKPKPSIVWNFWTVLTVRVAVEGGDAWPWVRAAKAVAVLRRWEMCILKAAWWTGTVKRTRQGVL